jgi:hypothetical protein
MDAETGAVSRSPVFRELIAEGRAGLADGGLSPEERERGPPVSELDGAYAAAFGAALDRLEEVRGSEVTDEQGRLLTRILTAGDYARGRAPLDRLAEASGIDEPTLRAAAVALEARGVEAPTPAARAG